MGDEMGRQRRHIIIITSCFRITVDFCWSGVAIWFERRPIFFISATWRDGPEGGFARLVCSLARFFLFHPNLEARALSPGCAVLSCRAPYVAVHHGSVVAPETDRQNEPGKSCASVFRKWEGNYTYDSWSTPRIHVAVKRRGKLGMARGGMCRIMSRAHGTYVPVKYVRKVL